MGALETCEMIGRRGFLGTILAAFVAPKVPLETPVPVGHTFAWYIPVRPPAAGDTVPRKIALVARDRAQEWFDRLPPDLRPQFRNS